MWVAEFMGQDVRVAVEGTGFEVWGLGLRYREGRGQYISGSGYRVGARGKG